MKISEGARTARATAALAAGLVVMPALLGASHPAAGSPAAKGPSLSVSVSDGRSTARSGDTLTYTVTVRDTGSTAARQLKITQTFSPGLKLVSASDHGAASSGQVSWTADLAAGGWRTFRAMTRVTRTPATLLRLSAVACVTPHGSNRPAVCAAHLDRLPAAAAAPAARSGLGPAPYLAAALAVLVLALLAVVAVRRRSRPRRQAA
jgi:uncharacterized repeat protein (TIGR01451 family)